jgi:hydroxyethylthiazole kinase
VWAVLLDPVAAGATKYRTQRVVDLLRHRPALIRGNASEILAVAGSAGAGGRGTDSTVGAEAALEAGQQLAQQQGCIVAISGATDLVTDGKRVVRVSTGHPGMQQITATGCTVTAVIAAFLAADMADPLMAAAYALCIYGLSAEAFYAAEPGNLAAPASLRTHMIDWLASGPEDIPLLCDAEARICAEEDPLN